ncbi:MAG: ECF-type sigma factor [Acidobacteriota bacterium]
MTAGITHWLARLRQGDDQALDQLVPLLYQELRAVARRQVRGERPERTLSTTALVHEAYVRLSDQHRLLPADRQDFLAAAAVTMRRILVDAARQRLAAKRGGEQKREPIEEVLPWLQAPGADVELVALDEALERLRASSARAHQVVELRFFAGLSLAETASTLGLSTKTVQRDWLAARAWLRSELLP